MSKLQLCLHHELMLLTLDDTKGHFAGTMFLYGLAGALLSEMILQGIISVSDDEKPKVELAGGDQTGDPIIDDVVGVISASKTPQELKHWVSKVACQPDFAHRVAHQLAELGILRYDEKKILWFFTQKRYPEVDGSYEDAIRSRMAEVMFSDVENANERTLVLILSLIHI